MQAEESYHQIVGEVEIQNPNNDLYSFVGKITIGTDMYPLTLANFIPKGS